MSQSEQTRVKSPDQGAHQQLGGLGCWREHDRMEDTWVVVPESSRNPSLTASAVEPVSSFNDRMRLLALANSPAEFAPDDSKEAANAAELDVERAVRVKNTDAGGSAQQWWWNGVLQLLGMREDYRVFTNIRIPIGGVKHSSTKKRSRRKHREIDTCVVTRDRVYVLEVKNWSGHVEVFENKPGTPTYWHNIHTP